MPPCLYLLCRRGMAMKKKAITLVLLLGMIFGGLYASDGKIQLETGIGPVYPLSSFVVGGGSVEEVPLYEYMDGGVGTVSGFFYSPARWFSIGLVTATDIIKVENGGTKYLISSPAMAALRFSPYSGPVSFPITLMGGGHMQLLGHDFKGGPAFGASIGIVIDVNSHFAVFGSSMAHTLVQFSSDDRVAYQTYIIPFSVGMRSYF